MQNTLSLLVASALVASTAAAQITYVDAVPNINTTLADGSPWTPTIASTNGGDNEWDERAFANGATIYESNGRAVTGAEDAPMLRTRISGLTPGAEYLTYAYFWGSTGAIWRGRAEVSTSQPTGDLPGYNTVHFATSSFAPMQPLGVGTPVGTSQLSLDLQYDAAGIGIDGHFAPPVLLQEGNRWLFETVLGKHAANAAGEIDVFIDDLANTGTSNRTWYDGVGYEPAPREFGSACGFGSLGATRPLVNLDFTMSLTGSRPGANAVAVFGISDTTWGGFSLPFPLAAVGGAPSCTLDVSVDVTNTVVVDQNGDASLTFNLPPAANGGQVFAQWLVLDRASRPSLGSSQAIELNVRR